MHLTQCDVDNILAILDQFQGNELDIQLNGVVLKVSAATACATAELSAGDSANVTGNIRHEAAVNAVPVVIQSPMLGIFHRSSVPTGAACVGVGASVNAEDAVGYVKAGEHTEMVKAGAAGFVAEFLAEDGAWVQYGEPILTIRGER